MRKFITRKEKLSYYSVESKEEIKNGLLRNRFTTVKENIKNYVVTKNNVEIGFFSLCFSNQLHFDVTKEAYFRVNVIDLYVLEEFRLQKNGIMIVGTVRDIASLSTPFPFEEGIKVVILIEPKATDELSVEEVKFFIKETCFRAVFMYEKDGYKEHDFVINEQLFSIPKMKLEVQK